MALLESQSDVFVLPFIATVRIGLVGHCTSIETSQLLVRAEILCVVSHRCSRLAARFELRPNDVLMTEGGDLDKLGRGFLWNGEIAGCLHQNHIFALRCFRHKLLPMFLTYVTASRYGRDYFEATGTRTTNLASTNSTKVGEFPIPLPTVKEQERLVEYLDARLDQLRSTQSVIESQIDTLVAYRKSLIHECVTGQRRISEADVRQANAAESCELSKH